MFISSLFHSIDVFLLVSSALPNAHADHVLLGDLNIYHYILVSARVWLYLSYQLLLLLQ